MSSEYFILDAASIKLTQPETKMSLNDLGRGTKIDDAPLKGYENKKNKNILMNSFCRNNHTIKEAILSYDSGISQDFLDAFNKKFKIKDKANAQAQHCLTEITWKITDNNEYYADVEIKIRGLHEVDSNGIPKTYICNAKGMLEETNGGLKRAAFNEVTADNGLMGTLKGKLTLNKEHKIVVSQCEFTPAVKGIFETSLPAQVKPSLWHSIAVFFAPLPKTGGVVTQHPLVTCSVRGI